MADKSRNFQNRVAGLREIMGDCDDLQRVAKPYLEAADWERISGLSIVYAVGINSAVDMHASVDVLRNYKRNCADCGQAASIFAGVETMTPTEVLTLVEG